MSILKVEKENNSEIVSLKTVNTYVRFLENLGQDKVILSGHLLAKDIDFKSPVFEAHGRERVIEVFSALSATDGYTFKVHHILPSDNPHTYFLRWDRAVQNGGERVVTSGMSEITVSLDFQIVSHIEYYDPRLNVKKELSLWGVINRFFKREY